MNFSEIEKYILCFVFDYFHYGDKYFDRESVPSIMASQLPTGNFTLGEIINASVELNKRCILSAKIISCPNKYDLTIEGFHSKHMNEIIEWCKAQLN